MSNTQKSNASNEPKTVTVAPVPAAPTVPDYITNCPELPPGATLFVLTPDDELERRFVQERLEAALNKYFEVAPTESHQIKVSRVPYGSLMFVAHCLSSRGRREDGTFGEVKTLHIGGPIDLKQYTARSADGYTHDTDIGRVVDAVTAACRHQNGVVWLGMTSGDKEKDQKVVKLRKS